MTTINPFLSFNGNAEEVFTFYKSVFKTEFKDFQRYENMPGAEKLSAEARNKVLHISLPIGKEHEIMGCDISEDKYKIKEGNNVHINIIPDSEKEADRLFGLLSEGGKVEVPIAKQFWNAYFGMLIDKFSIRWMINFDYR